MAADKPYNHDQIIAFTSLKHFFHSGRNYALRGPVPESHGHHSLALTKTLSRYKWKSYII